MFRAVAKLKMIECSFSPSVLPSSSLPPFAGREEKGRQSFSLGRRVGKQLFQQSMPGASNESARHI